MSLTCGGHEVMCVRKRPSIAEKFDCWPKREYLVGGTLEELASEQFRGGLLREAERCVHSKSCTFVCWLKS